MGTFSALLQDYRDIQANGCFYVYQVIQISEDGKRYQKLLRMFCLSYHVVKRN